MRPAAAIAAVLWAAAAQAEPFPSRTGGSGVLSVPEAQALPAGSAELGAEVGYQRGGGGSGELSPSPLSLTIGLGRRVEAGLSMRQGGMAGDPTPSPLLFGAALKVQLLADSPQRPALALRLSAERFNLAPGAALSLLASSGRLYGFLELAGFAGVLFPTFNPFKVGPEGGLAFSALHPTGWELAGQALASVEGGQLGAAVRRRFGPYVGVSLGADWIVTSGATRLSLGVAFGAPAHPEQPLAAPNAPPPEPAQKPAEPPKKFVVFVDPTPKFAVHPPPEIPPSTRSESLEGLRPGDDEQLLPVDEPRSSRPKLGLPFEPVALDFPSARTPLTPEGVQEAREALAQAPARKDLLIWMLAPADWERLPEAARRAVELKRQLLQDKKLKPEQLSIEVSSNLDEAAVRAVLTVATQHDTCQIPRNEAAGPCKSAPERIKLKANKPPALARPAVDAAALQLPTDNQPMRRADLAALKAIAQGARAAGLEVLLWARTGDDLNGLEKAAARAAALKRTLVNELGIPSSRVVVEVTAQPGVRGTEVLVSSHRQQGGGQ